jgi:hypothetical protein
MFFWFVGFILGWHFQGKWAWRKQQEVEQLVLGRTEDSFAADGRKTQNYIRGRGVGKKGYCVRLNVTIVF